MLSSCSCLPHCLVARYSAAASAWLLKLTYAPSLSFLHYGFGLNPFLMFLIPTHLSLQSKSLSIES